MDGKVFALSDLETQNIKRVGLSTTGPSSVPRRQENL